MNSGSKRKRNCGSKRNRGYKSFLPIVSVLSLAACAEAGKDVGQTGSELTQADCPAGSNIIVGTAGDDNLRGTNGDDCILGLGGNDTIDGRGGDDTISGGPGDDTLNGGNGEDFIIGDEGDDTIDGGRGCDEITALLGADTAMGGSGNDLIRAGASIASAMGYRGHDIILSAGANSANIDGGRGSDLCDGNDCENLPIACGSGCATGYTCDPITNFCVDDDLCATVTCGTSDTSCDGVDNDCNGLVDDGYISQSTTCGAGACASTGTTSCVAGVESDSCVPGTGSADDNCDGIDNDCDGLIDEDYDNGQTTSCGIGACTSSGTLMCQMGSEVDSCVPGIPAPIDSTCNAIDDDCDGVEDEDFGSTPTTCGIGACQSTGVTSCVNGGIEDSCVPGTPAPIDSTCNGLDDDCDGVNDEDYSAAPTTCGIGACQSTGALTCVNGATVDSCVPGSPDPIETCGNSLDDDCNGLVDDGC